MDEREPAYAEWTELTDDEFLKRMRANEADLLEILLRYNVKNKYEDQHKLLADQYERMARYHRDLVRNPGPMQPF